MNKKNSKILLSIVATVLCSLTFGLTSVDASIRESVNQSSTLSHIENGTTVVGITKFNPSTVVTAKRVSTATLNDIAYNSNNLSYAGTGIYYYMYGTWYEFDDANNMQVIGKADQIPELDIFYVDNVEKTIKINYAGPANVTFKTDKANKDRLVTLSGGFITVPATVNSLAVLNGSTTVATYAKGASAEGFIENPNSGQIQAGVNNSSLFSLVNEDTIIFQGRVPYKINKGENTLNGNFISVNIIAERLPSTNDKIVVYDGRNMEEGTAYTWDNGDSRYSLDVLLTEEVRAAAIQITWAEGNVQTFYVGITDTSMLDAIPVGTMDWDYETGNVSGNFNYLIDPETETMVSFNTKIKYYESLNGLSAGNRVGVAITPDTKYTKSTKIEVVGNAEDDDAVPAWKNGQIVYTPKLTESHTTEGTPILVKVTWEDGFTQTFTIDASGSILLTNE